MKKRKDIVCAPFGSELLQALANLASSFNEPMAYVVEKVRRVVHNTLNTMETLL